MNISLTTEHEIFIREKVESGEYASASEIIGAGLRLLDARDKHESLRREINKGIEDIKAGRKESFADENLILESIKQGGKKKLAESEKTEKSKDQ